MIGVVNHLIVLLRDSLVYIEGSDFKTEEDSSQAFLDWEIQGTRRPDVCCTFNCRYLVSLYIIVSERCC